MRRRERPERGIDRGALRRVERRAQQKDPEHQPDRQRRARRQHGDDAPAAGRHASMSRTFATSSRVENGLVT